MKLNTGEVFEPGQVWQTPKGTLWKVLRYENRKGEKQVLMRQGVEGTGRKQYRPWDKILDWTIYLHTDGTKT